MYTMPYWTHMTWGDVVYKEYNYSVTRQDGKVYPDVLTLTMITISLVARRHNNMVIFNFGCQEAQKVMSHLGSPLFSGLYLSCKHNI